MSISINYYLFASFWRLLKITLPCSRTAVRGARDSATARQQCSFVKLELGTGRS